MGHVERRAVQRHNRMVCFDDGADRFQMRAAGIALEDGYVLIHRAVHEDFWTLPGGRVEQGDTSIETIRREMREELLVEAEIGPLAIVVESFFNDIGQQFHEIGFYYTMRLPIGFSRLRGDVCHTILDGVRLEFRWVPADVSSLVEWKLFPEPLRPYIASPGPLLHIVDREPAG
jgi:ADP-ribose pyrophosphatase YjhB (NUDIX family)